MTNRQKYQLKDILSTLEKLNSSINNRNDPNFVTPLQVELIEKEKTKKRKMFLGKGPFLFLIITLVIVLEVLALYITPKVYDDFESESKNMKCYITYPSYIAAGDKNVIELTFKNCSEAPISGVLAFFIYPEKSPIVITSKDGSSVADFGLLRATESKTQKLNISLKRPICKCEVSFNLKVISKNTKKINEPYNVGIFIIPLIKAISGWFFTSFFWIIVTAIVIEKLKLIF